MLGKNWAQVILRLARAASVGLFLFVIYSLLASGTAEATNYNFSGYLRDSLGNPVSSATITATSTTTGSASSVGTNSSGFFTRTLNSDTYTLSFTCDVVNNHSSTTPPGRFTSTSGPVLDITTGNVSKDFIMDLAVVHVTVLDAFGAPVSNAAISARGIGAVSMGPAGIFQGKMVPEGLVSNYVVKTDTFGNATVYLPKGMSYDGIIAYPATGKPYYNTSLGTLAGDTNITIQPPSTTHTISGTFRDALGTPMPYNPAVNSVTLTDPISNATYSGIANTSPTGVYTITAPSAYYNMSFGSGGASVTSPPGGVSAGASTPIPTDLRTTNISRDIQYDSAVVTVHVVDSNGAPVPNQRITASGSGFTTVAGAQTDANLIPSTGMILPQTDSNGNARLYMPKGLNYTSVSDVWSSGQLFNSGPLGVVTSDTNITLQLPPMYNLHGIFRDTAGHPVSGQFVALEPSGCTANIRYGVNTAADGSYTIKAPAGSYCFAGSLAHANHLDMPLGDFQFSSFDFNYNASSWVTITQDTTLDLTPDSATYSVNVLDTAGNPVPNTSVSITNTDPNGTFSLYPGSKLKSNQTFGATSANTDSNGVVSFRAYKGMTYQLSANTASPRPTFQDTLFTGDKSVTLRYQNTTTYTVSGTVTNQSQQAVPGASVEIINPATGLTAGTATANASGVYSTVVSAGTYNVRFTPPTGSGLVTKTLPGVGVSGNLTLNATLNPPTSVLSGQVTSAGGSGIANVGVQVVNPSNHSAVLGTTTSDLSGYYAVSVTSGTYDVIYTPTDTYAPATRTNVNLAQDATLNVTLDRLVRTISGRVVDGANIGITNVRVQIVDPSDHTNVRATAYSDNGGYYAATVVPGTYDVVFTPAVDTYEPTTKTGINLTTDTTLDVALVLKPRTFSGTLTDQYGTAVFGAVFNLVDQGGQSATVTTGTDGSFWVQVNPALYTVTLTGSKAASPLATVPDQFRLSNGAVDLTADFSEALVLHTATVTLTTKNAVTNAPVGNTNLAMTASTSTTLGSHTFTGTSSLSASTDVTTGVAPVVMLTGTSYTVTATPPSGSGALTTSFPSEGPVTADYGRDLPLAAVSRTYSGSLIGNDTQTINGASVSIGNAHANFHGQTNTAGQFNINAIADTYTIGVSGSKGSNPGRLPQNYALGGAAADLTSSDLNQDMVMNTEDRVTTVTSPSGEVVASAAVQINCTGSTDLYAGGTFSGTTTANGTTRADGTFPFVTIVGFNCTYTVIPPAGGGLTCTPSNSSDVVCQRQMWNYTGTLKDKNGVGIDGAVLHIDGSQSDLHYTTPVGTNGSFSLPVAQYRGYTISFTGTALGSPGTAIPDNFTLTKTQDVLAEVNEDDVVNTVDLTITSRDDRHNPIANVSIDFSSTGSQNGFTASSSHIARTTALESDNQAHAHTLMLYGTTYTISADPPAGIGYINTTFNGSSPVLTNAETILEFQNHIPEPPTNLRVDKDPTNLSPALAWDAVADADHYKVYRDGVVIGTASSTNFTDNTLATDSTYQYRVSAISADGYESARSLPASDTYDTTAPAITASATLADGSTYTTGTWTNQSVTVHFTCSDNLSGVDLCSGDQSVSAETAGTTITGTVTDNAGNQATSVGFVVKIDQTAPALGDPSFSVNPKSVGQTSVLSATVTDSGVGVAAGEYYVGNIDPGVDQATAMILDNGTLSTTVGTQLPAGTYTYHIRAKDTLGNWSGVKSADLTVVRPAAPTGLTAPSPTHNDPVLSWTASPDAAKYYVYRDGTKLATEPTGTSFTDTGRPGGTYVYRVSAVNSFGDESDLSTAVTVVVDKTAPSIDTLNWTTNPLVQGQSTTLSASVTETGSSVSSVSYKIDNGTPQAMTYDSALGVWKVTFGSSLAVSTYNISVIATDAAGNTSGGLMDVLAVYNSANGYVAGHEFLPPSASDALPIARDTTTQNPSQVVVGFTGQPNSTTSVDMNYTAKSTGDSFSFSSTSVNWLVIPDSTHASLLVHGDLTTTVGGVVTTIPNVTIRIEVTLGASGPSDLVSVNFWTTGVNYANNPATWHISELGTQPRSHLVIRESH